MNPAKSPTPQLLDEAGVLWQPRECAVALLAFGGVGMQNDLDLA